MKTYIPFILSSLLLFCLACLGSAPLVITPTVEVPTQTPFLPIHHTPTLETSSTPTSTQTVSPSPTNTPTASATPEPFGCQKPPDDYTFTTLNGYAFNARTVAMLKHAQELYGGIIDITGDAITQGSFHDNGAASFGTHLGGGAVDIAVMIPGTYTVATDEIEPLIHAMRTAGFAAWLRLPDELYSGSAIHIHAIAIGDEQLSTAAQEQLTGERGYFRGLTGIPYNDPALDRHGGPIICQWMLDMGYSDMRTPEP